MHPRNVFVLQPDYTDLAIKYAEFRKMCKLVSILKISLTQADRFFLILVTKWKSLHRFKK